MQTDAQEFRREQQRERRAARPVTGPCHLCGAYRPALLPGRDAGHHVYCELCAIGTRTPATLEER